MGVSFDVRLPLGSRLALGLGGAAVTVSPFGPGLRVALPDGGSYRMRPPSGWVDGGWWHFEADNTRLEIDGRSLALRPSSATTISFRVEAGRPQVAGLIASGLVVGPAAELDVADDGVLGAAGAVISDRFALDQSAGDGIRTTAPGWWGPSRGTLALRHERVSGWSPDADGFAAQ